MPDTPLAALTASVAVLAVANLLNNRLARAWYLPTSLGATAALLILFRLAGRRWVDAGLGRAGLGRAGRWALVLALLVAFGYAVAVMLPGTRRVFVDRRVRDARFATAVYQVLVRIPAGTVLLEEVAFRGVLYGLLRETYGLVWATAVSSALFGLWHLLPASELPRLNPAAARTFRPRRALLPPAAMVSAAVAGLILCEAARRGGSLLAPMALHWVVNSMGYLTALLVTRRVSGPGRRAGAEPPGRRPGPTGGGTGAGAGGGTGAGTAGGTGAGAGGGICHVKGDPDRV